MDSSADLEHNGHIQLARQGVGLVRGCAGKFAKPFMQNLCRMWKDLPQERTKAYTFQATSYNVVTKQC